MAVNILDQILDFFLSSPVGWSIIIIAVIVYFAWKGGLFRSKPEMFKGETLKEILLRDLKPRMTILGSKTKWRLIYQFKDIGRVHRITQSDIEFFKEKEKDKDKKEKAQGFAVYRRKEKRPEFIQENVNLVYMLVGGNLWLSWIPFTHKWDPQFFVLKEDHIKIEANRNVVVINESVHLYPYGEVWVSDMKTQRYLTELEARRTLENESETRVNTLKRWVHYGEQRSAKILTLEEKERVESEKWEKSRDYGTDT